MSQSDANPQTLQSTHGDASLAERYETVASPVANHDGVAFAGGTQEAHTGMLIIRNEQMHVFGTSIQEQFIDRMVAHLANEFTAKHAVWGDAGTREFVRRVILAGDQNGVRSIGAVAVLIELMAQFGERFELSPDKVWARKLLAHPTLPDRPKVEALRDRLASRTGGRRIVMATPPGCAADAASVLKPLEG